jgi:hypothetical protein
MTDTTSIDLGPFFERYDLRNRLVFVAAIAASLALSAVIFLHGVLMPGAPRAIPAVVWGLGVVFPPVFIVGWWIFGELLALGRRRTSLPDGRLPASADDASNGVRIANGGFAFNLVVTATVIAQQALMALFVLGYPPVGDLILRATTVTLGVVTIYLGNLWPRMPTPRAPERKAVVRMKVNRFSGWLMVTVGLLVVLLGLFLPLLYPLVRLLPRP